MPEINTDTATREELIDEIRRLRNIETGIARIEELHAKPGEMEADIKLNPALKTYLLYCLVELLADAPNYTESKFELAGHVGDKAEWITVTILKGSGKTPHELRREAENELTELKEKLKNETHA